jgi:hypothetical protein
MKTTCAYRLLMHPLEEDDYVVYPLKMIHNVSMFLMRRGFLRNNADVVLAFMGNRQILSEVVTLGSKPVIVQLVSHPNHKAHEEQLRRVLPMPLWKNLVITSILSCMGTLAIAGFVAQFAPTESRNFLCPNGILLWLVLSLMAVIWQHVFRSLGANMIKSALTTLAVFFLVLANLIPLESATWLGRTIEKTRLPLPFFLTSFILVFLLIPEFIAHWRGAHLLYPTRRQLWGQRVLWTGLAMGACILLALLTLGLSYVLTLTQY